VLRRPIESTALIGTGAAGDCFFVADCKNDILSYMKNYEIIAAGGRCSYFDAMVESLQEAGIQAQQMLIADYDRRPCAIAYPRWRTRDTGS
jgi:hypothetical protein